MKLEAGVRYVLNDGRETEELKKNSSGGYFTGKILDRLTGLSYPCLWFSDGRALGSEENTPQCISHPVPLRFSRRKSQL